MRIRAKIKIWTDDAKKKKICSNWIERWQGKDRSLAMVRMYVNTLCVLSYFNYLVVYLLIVIYLFRWRCSSMTLGGKRGIDDRQFGWKKGWLHCHLG